ncbi:MAG: phosphoenolpyruvate--protein phosphotransferase [Haliea sp.]|uniref:phosphoenolpyruvate--protein phosphotransferase n=1 Tax=Haliea sp. TaxID=1932666 RepID=UPI0032EC6B59
MNTLQELTRIVQAAAQADQTEDQVKLIVEAIHRAIHVDVCSLYIAATDGTMALVASRGLDPQAVGYSRLAPGRGLVGRVAQSRHPINVADAASHPDFCYLAETREDEFRSFCGVPVVRAGAVIGVLVVQSREGRVMSADEQAFLVTLSTQLALVLPPEPLAAHTPANTLRRVRGVKGAPGTGIGSAWLCETVDLYAVPDRPCEDPAATIDEWHQLLAKVSADMDKEREALGEQLSDGVGAVFTAYQMLLNDPGLRTGVEQAIAQGQWLPGALRQVVHHYAEVFLAMEDPYLRARNEDLHHLGNKLYQSWSGAPENSPADDHGPLVLTGAKVSVSDIAACDPQRLVGIVCYEGSSLSHTAVLANALGIPAVMGTGKLKGIDNGSPLIVDGNTGQVILFPSPSVRLEFERLQRAELALKGELAGLRDQPATTTDGERVRLLANTGLLADISPGLANGAEGIGLYRTEMPFMVSESFPSEDEQLHIYRQVLAAYRGRPVYMRILDIGGDKPLPYFPIHEENPALGWRGIRFCLDNSSLLMTQVRAMLRAAAGGDELHILLPMVSNTGEINAFHGVLQDALQQLREEGVEVQRPQVGIMVEVPAAISLLPAWAPKLDFFSIGSNDLSQYLLALDRNNPRVAGAYDHIHPAVLQEIARITTTARSAGLPLSLCGEMASDPAGVVFLLGIGIRKLSMSASKLPRIKWLLRSMAASDAADLARQALTLDNSADIRQLLEGALHQRGLGRLLGSE